MALAIAITVMLLSISLIMIAGSVIGAGRARAATTALGFTYQLARNTTQTKITWDGDQQDDNGGNELFHRILTYG